ncbi:MAG: hypothetical protein ACI3VN_10565 [Candidatus Onthomonas sp.]
MSNVITVADLVIDWDARTVRRGETSVSLSSKEFSVLEYLARNSGRKAGYILRAEP